VKGPARELETQPHEDRKRDPQAFRKLVADGWHEKALAARGTTESTEAEGSPKAPEDSEEPLAVIRKPDRIFEKSESKGRVLAREVAPSR